MEYTILSSAAFLLSLYLALALIKMDLKSLLTLCAVSLIFQLIFDNYMTSLGLWVFDYSFTLGLALPFIPLENLLFGLSLTISTAASWELMNQK